MNNTNNLTRFLNPQTYYKTAERKLVELFLNEDQKTIRRTKNEFNEAYRQYLQTGKTSHEGYMSMLKLFCLTSGHFNQEMHEKIKEEIPPQKKKGPINGIIGTLNDSDFDKVDQKLKKDGYVNFDKKLSTETCARLYEYALKTPAKVLGSDEKILYDPKNPIYEAYRIQGLDLVNNEDFQSLIMDPALIQMVRNYFGSEPIFDWTNMWWSPYISDVPSEDAAQLYHFDMERIKWFAVFFYVTDVDADNGPHCYIRGSHIPGNKPLELLKRGYARIPDSDLLKYYPKEDFTEIHGSAGSIFAGDTICWHKAKPLKKGHRLVFQLEYTSSMFGVNRPRMVVSNYSPAFKKFCEQNPTYSSSLHFDK